MRSTTALTTPVILHGMGTNHNETLITAPVIRRGGVFPNHNETVVGRLATPVIYHGFNLGNHNEMLVGVRAA